MVVGLSAVAVVGLWVALAVEVLPEVAGGQLVALHV